VTRLLNGALALLKCQIKVGFNMNYEKNIKSERRTDRAIQKVSVSVKVGVVRRAIGSYS
jgi:hypothetical protein